MNTITATSIKKHWLVRMHHQMRAVAFAMVFVATTLHLTGKNYSFASWTFLVLLLLIYPHLQYWRSLRTKDPIQAEMTNLQIDSVLLGIFIAVVGFSDWLTFSVMMGTLSNNAANKGLRGIRDSLIALLGGVLIGCVVGGFNFSPHTDLPATLICIAGLGGYLLAMNIIGFSRNEQLRQTREQLETHKTELRKLSRAVEQSPVVIVITDVNGIIEFVNPRFTDVTGYSAKEAIGQNPRLLKSGNTPEKVYKDLWSAITSGNRWEGEFHNKCKDGRMFWEYARISPLRDAEGVITHYLAVKEDITEKKQIIEQLVIAKQNADTANRAKSEFLANMSHEIRTPMNGVMGMTQLLELTDLTADQQGYVNDLKLSGNNLLSLVNDILDLSKIEAGKITIEPQEFELRRAIDEVCRLQKSAIFEKMLALNITVAEDMPDVIIGDQLRVKQIILNLLGNAAKFTKQGGIAIAARIHERHLGSSIIEISVTDTGIGISAESFEKIFNPFVQEDGSTTRQFGGTGLGLTISRRLAELMGGGISVESTQGVGSSFILRLPVTIPTTIQHTDEIKSQIPLPTWDGPPLRILLVDDNHVNLKFASLLIGKHGHRVVTAENGRECLEALTQEEFDLVMMDVQMPVMNGEEALRAIRAKDEGTPFHQKIIAVTAHALRNEKERFLGEGFDGYLSKPMVQKEMVAEMKRVMSLTF